MTDTELLARADAVAGGRMRRTRGTTSAARYSLATGVIEGVNVKNAAYPLGVCAERTAFARAIVEGYRPATSSRRDHGVAVRRVPQWLVEMGVERVVFRHGGVRAMTLDELLPSSSTPATSREIGVRRRRGPAERRQVDARQRTLRRQGRDHVERPEHDPAPDLRRRERARLAARARRPAGVPASDGRADDGCRTVDAAFRGRRHVLLVVSARDRIGAGDRFVGRRVFSSACRDDRGQQDRPPEARARRRPDEGAATLGDFHALHPVSAKTKDGIGELRDDLVRLLPEGPPISRSTIDRPDDGGGWPK